MSEHRYRQILDTFNEDQLAVLRISIIAERRLRTQPDGSVQRAYDFALAQVP